MNNVISVLLKVSFCLKINLCKETLNHFLFIFQIWVAMLIQVLIVTSLILLEFVLACTDSPDDVKYPGGMSSSTSSIPTGAGTDPPWLKILPPPATQDQVLKNSRSSLACAPMGVTGCSEYQCLRTNIIKGFGQNVCPLLSLYRPMYPGKYFV